MSLVTLKNVTTHNLKSIDVSFHNGEFIVLTGVSGSGKSSLAFDTIFIEGQKKYISSLTSFIRKHFKHLKQGHVEDIFGITPTLAIEQKSIIKHLRSTVGTMTEIYDYLRVLFAKLATPFCPISQKPVMARSKEKILSSILKLNISEKISIFYPLIQGKKGEFKEEIQNLIRQGFNTLRINNEIINLFDQPQFDKDTLYYIDVLMDSLVISPENTSRITENVLLALEHGKGSLFISFKDKPDIIFSQEAYSVEADCYYQALEPQDFSFNNPKSMCLTCFGLGEKTIFNKELVIDPNKSISEDCCLVAKSFKNFLYKNIYSSLGKIFSFDIYAPWKTLSKTHQDIFLYGTGIKKLKIEFHTEKSSWQEFISWKGVLNEAAERYDQAKSSSYKKKYEHLLRRQICPSCEGKRLRPYPAAARFHNKNISELANMPMKDLLVLFKTLQKSRKESPFEIELINDLVKKIETLCNLGLSYLTCNRTSTTLSGGEAQRVRLASQIGSRLVDVTYIFDEPSIGLHPKDTANLIRAFQQLRSEGNTVIVVEHDEETMLSCDRIIDIGPGAGSEGGHIVFNGKVKDFLKSTSLTAQYLRRDLYIPPKNIKSNNNGHKLILKNACLHNLQNVSIEIPLGKMIAVTGVSGSGKSSLITDTLVPLLSRNEDYSFQSSLGHLKGREYIDKVINIDQSPVGKNPRSNPATYLKFFDKIRQLFSETSQSILYGYTISHFSFNTSEGSCPDCQGRGYINISTEYEDYEIECETCLSQRFDESILEVKFNEKNISDVLNMTVKEAAFFFSKYPSIYHSLQLLVDIGLHYLKLGRPTSSLSGGEAQRIKLVKELLKPTSKHTIYILDEPTTGLHFHDVKHLINILDRFVGAGHTVLVIEHNMEIVKVADLIIDLGPEGGNEGGRIIGYGPPEKIARQNTYTGKALIHALQNTPAHIPPLKKQTLLYPHSIVVENAHHNNLKNLYLKIPKNKITALTGVSGSGKSSLAFDTLFAEGQLRFLNSLPPYIRSLISQPEKPKVDKISGISPTISIERKVASNNPRSTIGTITEVYEYLKVIFSYRGQAFCPETQEPISKITKQYVIDKTYTLYNEKIITILSPLGKKHNNNDKMIHHLRTQGFLKIKFNETLYDIDEPIPWYSCPDQCFVIIDHFKLYPHSLERLASDIDRATSLSKNQVIIESNNNTHFFNLDFCVASTGKCFPDITPKTFSFNSKEGMCLECLGLGYEYGANFELLSRAFPESPLNELCYKLTNKQHSLNFFSSIFKELSIDPLKTLNRLTEQEIFLLLHGSSKILSYNNQPYIWRGVSYLVKQSFQDNFILTKKDTRLSLQKYQCSSCQGKRLNKLACNVKINNLSICDICEMPLGDIKKVLKLPESSHPLFSLLKSSYHQLFCRLDFLVDIGLSYINLNRSSESLSHGEMQKIHFARQLGSQLSGITYIIDEPTTGLHPQDIKSLESALIYLKSLNNTIIMVENNLFLLPIADHIIDLGPLSGNEGGKIIAQGTLNDISTHEDSLTGLYLSKKKTFVQRTLKDISHNPRLHIKKGSSNNIKNLTIDIPLNACVAIAGVSGSGKTSLIQNIIEPHAKNLLNSHECSFKKVIFTNQDPLHTSVRSDIGTFLDLSPKIREFFSELASARVLGLKPGHFSYNSPLGKCTECLGLGHKIIDVSFLPPVSIVCDQCHGNCLSSLSLTIKYNNYHFGDILKISIAELKKLFVSLPKVKPIFDILSKLRLDYLSLGRKLSELSAGEVQRLKLAKGLLDKNKEPSLYLLDEPSTGLHIDDINYLQKTISTLVNEGHSVIFCEHNLNMIANADIVIELGPQAGAFGGKVIYQGPVSPECTLFSK